jgi:mersacidin/lichenicidin family type 2 lantibiotic
MLIPKSDGVSGAAHRRGVEAWIPRVALIDKEDRMSNEMIIRAWKDPQFRSQLGAAVAPANPAGNAQLVAAELQGDAYLTSPICTDFGPRCSNSPTCE